jgi:acyl-CoA synthetase (NDP forming)
MRRDLSRLLRPASVAVLGGGWASNVVAQLQKAGFGGDIWPVHPQREEILGVPCIDSVQNLPAAPDACFVGVNRELTVEIVEQLSAMGAGGAVCFASGFLESEADDAGGAALQKRLLAAAGDMPFLGPNCYGLVNYIDGVPLWPDEHGGGRVDRGVAIIAQSSNIAINISMQRRGLPLAYLVAAGNQAQMDAAHIAETLLQDENVSAIGFYLEGFGSIRSFEHLARLARAAGKPLVALKSGQSAASRHAAVSHTASLAGSAAASSALLQRLGIVEVDSLDVFLETLKILHFAGPLENNRITSVSCSGGEAALMADGCEGLALEFDEFSPAQRTALLDCLGPRVNIANPLDYHTYIWGDVDAMTRCFSAVCGGGAALNVFVVDVPRDDLCDTRAWNCVTEALAATKSTCDAPIAVLSSIAENMSETLARQFIEIGCVPLNGMDTGLRAVNAAARAGRYMRRGQDPVELLLAPVGPVGGIEEPSRVLEEHRAKLALAEQGLAIPAGMIADDVESLRQLAGGVVYPCVLKARGLAHKSDSGAVVLNIQSSEELMGCAEDMAARLGGGLSGFLVENMVDGAIAELLVGITRDSTGLFVLTLGFGGTLTELIKDSVSLLLPCDREQVAEALKRLKLYPLVEGYRGGPAADLEAILDAVESMCRYAGANAARLLEVEVNPLILRERGTVAADALLRLVADQSN